MRVSTTEQREREGAQRPGQDLEQRKAATPLPLYNGVISPDRWTMFGRMAMTVANTDFVPKGLRGKPDSVMACLVFGDSLGLHPSTALKEVFVADGKVGISGALMLALIRNRGHKIAWEEITTENIEQTVLGDGFVGWKCLGQRIDPDTGEVTDEDSWTYTMEDAKRAGLYPNSSDRASWMKNPKLMCRWRALAQVARFLFSDVFVGQSIYTPDETEEIAYGERVNRNGAPAETGQERSEGDIDYGSDPWLAAWLVALFAAANDMEPGVWLPKKQALALKDKTQEQREDLALQVAQWIEERGGVVPPKPEENDEHEAVEEGEYEVVGVADEGQPDEDPGLHLGDEPEQTGEGEDEVEATTVD
jgi:hypothetical protein